MPEKADSTENPVYIVFSRQTLLGQGLTSPLGTARDEQRELVIKQGKPNTLLSPTVCGHGILQ